MGKKLAIQGHEKRGGDVINILKILGGTNYVAVSGINEEAYYFIDEEGIIDYDCTLNKDDNYLVFSLEEFLEKYPFYNGDKVFDITDRDPGIITAMKWDEDVSDMKYHVAFDNGDMGWYTNDTIEFLKEDNKEMNGNIETNQCKVNGLKRGDEYPIMEGVECNECIKYYFPEGYEFVDTDDTGVYLKPIKPKYPTTYVECCKVMGVSYRAQLSYTNPDVERGNTYLTKEKQLLDSFMRLRICRNAYWKIAGEEMGLDKPWKPDWTNAEESKYCLVNKEGTIDKWIQKTMYKILAFPTKEMRDTFYENFKDLIEQCKKLLLI